MIVFPDPLVPNDGSLYLPFEWKKYVTPIALGTLKIDNHPSNLWIFQGHSDTGTHGMFVFEIKVPHPKEDGLIPIHWLTAIVSVLQFAGDEDHLYFLCSFSKADGVRMKDEEIDVAWETLAHLPRNCNKEGDPCEKDPTIRYLWNCITEPGRDPHGKTTDLEFEMGPPAVRVVQ